ncbi:hypothetical protein PHLGIDRAFT_115251 [Phlebiopsis gigantea 11061_1 CR5-6]|uniref:Alpha-type protein kinase domain-containing protein n=1 Tax=Phlebiopsis gigantea (strain 11061_1 CR5-6) TaxID=745531 RepID=A0A0C3PT78_PHLG1|nr:hypothetical protein PHLGIDRAFT_115251 [Phlebiopsis gigantea 11061_1 CR5-6]
MAHRRECVNRYISIGKATLKDFYKHAEKTGTEVAQDFAFTEALRVLFDIMGHTPAGGLQGAVGNAGQNGVITWMVQHACYSMCKNMGLKPLSTGKATGSSMVDYPSSEDEPADE